MTIYIHSLLFSESHLLSCPLGPSYSIVACSARSLIGMAPRLLIKSKTTRNPVWHPNAGVRSHTAHWVGRRCHCCLCIEANPRKNLASEQTRQVALMKNHTDATSLHPIRRVRIDPIHHLSARLVRLGYTLPWISSKKPRSLTASRPSTSVRPN